MKKNDMKSGSKWASDNRSLSEIDEDEKASIRLPSSPLSWLCDFSRERRNRLSGTKSTTDSKDIRREFRSNSISFLQHDSDEEVLNNAYNSSSPELVGSKPLPSLPPTQQLQLPSQQQLLSHQQQSSVALLRSPNPSTMTTNMTSPEMNPFRPMQGEARIVAPNVSKLSPHSAIEVRLQSPTESVAILCSVDVLKMRSSFFHDLLIEQEKNISVGSGDGSNFLNMLNGNIMWREPIIIPEVVPFEAAAFLESLHEGRVLFRGEWNMCWARLSVTWVVEDLIAEFANQIEDHMNKINQIVLKHHWRNNPAVLTGMRVAVFRKGSNNTPTIVTGMVVDAGTSIAYSRVRIAFDSDHGFRTAPSLSNMISSPMMHQQQQRFSRPSMMTPLLSPRGSTNLTASQPDLIDLCDFVTGKLSAGTSRAASPNLSTGSISAMDTAQHIAGDISEPFWIQSTKEGSFWMDPDEFSLSEVKKIVTATDKRVFWEMAKSIIDLPELSLACKSGIRCPQDITTILKRPDYRVLWSVEGAEIITKEMSVELLRTAYLSSTPSSLHTPSDNSNLV
eukprot:scaffold659_cov192-Ochromonas_danica.AAC.14